MIIVFLATVSADVVVNDDFFVGPVSVVVVTVVIRLNYLAF